MSTSASQVTIDSATGRAASALIAVSIKVSLSDRNGKVLTRIRRTFFANSTKSRKTSVAFEEDSPAFRRLSQDFARTLVSDILEGF